MKFVAIPCTWWCLPRVPCSDSEGAFGAAARLLPEVVLYVVPRCTRPDMIHVLAFMKRVYKSGLQVRAVSVVETTARGAANTFVQAVAQSTTARPAEPTLAATEVVTRRVTTFNATDERLDRGGPVRVMLPPPPGALHVFRAQP